jgi:enoyl-CoA hydratase/carnithine racemase
MPLSPRSFQYELDAATSVATITLNRPERLNALTFEVYGELRDAFRTLDTEPGVRAIVLTGAGRAFSSPSSLNLPLTRALFALQLTHTARQQNHRREKYTEGWNSRDRN